MAVDTEFNYGAYLASREWGILREQVRERSGGKCERCKRGDHQDTHHLTYERIGHERLEDLLGVCRQCHEFLSGKTDVDPAGQDVVYFNRVRAERDNGYVREWFVCPKHNVELRYPSLCDYGYICVAPTTDGGTSIDIRYHCPVAEKGWHAVTLRMFISVTNPQHVPTMLIMPHGD